MSKEFDQACEAAKQLNNPSNDELLLLYKYYKQSTIGDAPVTCPCKFYNVRGKAKYEAWSSIRGMSSGEAKQKYIETVHSLS